MASINLKDIKLSLSQGTLNNIQKALEKRSKILGRARSYEARGSSERFRTGTKFVSPVYDLSEIARATDVEPYVMSSIRKHRTHILKEGYEITGKDPKTVEYIKNRLYEIAMTTGIPTEAWVRELVTNVIMYHNGYLLFRRDTSRSSGRQIRMYGKTIDPIAGIFIADPITMEVEVDVYGTPIKWRQALYAPESFGVQKVEKQFDPEDVLHIPVDKRTGYTFGTPYLLSVLDDVRALRKLEELSLVLAEREAFPLYHYKVGTEDRPAMIYDDGSNEVDAVIGQLSAMPSQGYIITSERHEVKLISRDKSSMDLHPLLQYFESRVLGGLSLSPLDLGRGETANRGTATSVSKNLEDSAQDYQTTISAYLTQHLIIPLLLEGGYDVTLKNMVYFSFPLISKEEERALQNHGLQLMMGNAITIDEFRQDYLKKSPMKEDQMSNTLQAMELEGQVKLAKVAAKAKAAAAPAKKGTAKQVTNRAKPANQHGSKIKSRFKKNDHSLNIDAYLENFKKSILSISPQSDQIKDLVETAMSTLVRDCVTATSDVLMDYVDSGFAVAKEQYEELALNTIDEVDDIGSRSLSRFKTNFITGSYWKVLNPHKKEIANAIQPDADGKSSSFLAIKNIEIIKKSIQGLITDQVDTSFRYGFIRFAKRMGYKFIELVDTVSKELVEQINIEDVIYKEFIPTDKNANCELRLPLGDQE